MVRRRFGTAWRGLGLALVLALGVGAPGLRAQSADEIRQAFARAEQMGVVVLGYSESERRPRTTPARFPIPQEPHQVFFVQNSSNPNTVIYAARFDAEGNLDRRNPLDIYWRRYNDQGERRELRRVESFFAYGVSVRRTRDPGTFRITFRAVPQFELLLRQDGPFSAAIYGTHEGQTGRLVSLYLELGDYRFIPQIDRARLVAVNMANGRYLDVQIVPVQ